MVMKKEVIVEMQVVGYELFEYDVCDIVVCGYCKVCCGYVVSDKMDKIIVVEVEDCVKYLFYGKVICCILKVKVYDEVNFVGIGDLVLINEICLLSVMKCWCLVEILEKVK